MIKAESLSVREEIVIKVIIANIFCVPGFILNVV